MMMKGRIDPTVNEGVIDAQYNVETSTSLSISRRSMCRCFDCVRWATRLFARLGKNIPRHARKCLHHILDESWAGIFSAERIVRVVRHFRKVHDLPLTVLEVQEIRSAFS